MLVMAMVEEAIMSKIYTKVIESALYYIWDRGIRERLTDNFYTQEFECRCVKCKNQIISVQLVNGLQYVRSMIRMPIIINSGFRCESHNASLSNSSPDSMHLRGRAVDVVAPNYPHQSVLGLIFASHGYRVGLYEKFLHIDNALYEDDRMHFAQI